MYVWWQIRMLRKQNLKAREATGLFFFSLTDLFVFSLPSLANDENDDNDHQDDTNTGACHSYRQCDVTAAGALLNSCNLGNGNSGIYISSASLQLNTMCKNIQPGLCVASNVLSLLLFLLFLSTFTPPPPPPPLSLSLSFGHISLLAPSNLILPVIFHSSPPPPPLSTFLQWWHQCKNQKEWWPFYPWLPGAWTATVTVCTRRSTSTSSVSSAWHV